MVDCQYPDDYISGENFKLIAHAVIPRADLSDQPITIAEFGHLIIGFPQRIEGTQYSRNTLLFNLCFILRPRESQREHYDLTGQNFPLDYENIDNGLQPAVQSAYELTVRKINRYLAYMEEENAALSRNTIKKCINKGGETLIHRLLRQIFTDLREQGLCVTGLGDDLPPLYLIFAPRAINNSVSTCFIPTEAELPTFERRNRIERKWKEEEGDERFTPGAIGGTDVWSRVPCALEDSTAIVSDATVFVRVRPVLTSLDNHVAYVLDQNSDADINVSSFWEARDLVSSRLLPLVNGQRTVAQVASLTYVDRSIARLCLTQLAQLGVVRVVSAPVFLHSTAATNAGSSNASELFAVPGYMGLPKLLRLTVDAKFRDACFESVLSTTTRRKRLHITDPEVLIMKVIRVYSKLCASPYLNLPFLLASTKSFVDLTLPAPLPTPQETKNSNLPCINLLRLVQFGEVNNLIHRLRCYPISEGLSFINSSETSSLDTRMWSFLHDRMMDGVQSVDDLVYEASAWTIKTSPPLPMKRPIWGHFTEGWPKYQQSGATATLPDAVVAFTAKLLKEKAGSSSSTDTIAGGGVLSEANRVQSLALSAEHDRIHREDWTRKGAVHLLWH